MGARNRKASTPPADPLDVSELPPKLAGPRPNPIVVDDPAPIPAAEWVDLATLEVWGENPWKHPRSQVQRIKDSILANGWGEPMLAHRSSRRIIAGHGRRLAVIELQKTDPAWKLSDAPHPGWVPVRWIDGAWNQAAIAHAFASNLGHLGREEDDDVARRVLRELHAEGDLTRRAFGMPEDKLVGYLDDPLVPRDAKPAPGNRVEGDDDLEPPPVAVSELGAVYHLGPHVLVCGDCLMDSPPPEASRIPPEAGAVQKLKAAMAIEYFDCGLTDPPYAIYGSSTGVSSSVTDDKIVRPFFRAVCVRLEGLLRLFGPGFIFCDWRSYPTLFVAAGDTHLEVKNKVVWDKNGSGLGSNFANTYEEIVYVVKMPPQLAMKSGRATTGIRSILKPNILHHDRARGDDREHNAAKPVPLLVELLEAATDTGGTVVDMFGGSGSTLIAAAECGRRCGIVELEPRWCDVIRRRWTRWAAARGIDPGDGALT